MMIQKYDVLTLYFVDAVCDLSYVVLSIEKSVIDRINAPSIALRIRFTSYVYGVT